MKTTRDLLSDPAHGLVKEARPPQLAMAASVEEVLASGGAYYCEAPVATGKTFAYLLPALLASGRRIVVATAKKGLQDQIVGKDLPTLKRVLGQDVVHALGGQMLATALKGKGNYACAEQAMSLIEKNGYEHSAEYQAFLRKSMYGDRADYEGSLPRWWGLATAEDCAGKRCSRFDECGYIRLKRDAAQSKIVVVNHHVLGAEMFFGLGKLVGGPYDTLIVDEAHTLAAGIRSAFTHRIAEDSIQMLSDLLKRTSHQFPAVRRLLEPWSAMFATVPNRHYQDASAREVPVFDKGAATACLDGLRSISFDLEKVEKLYNQSNEQDEWDEEPDEIFGENVMPSNAIEIEMEAHEAGLAESKGRELALISQGLRRVDGLLRGLSAAQGIVDAVDGDADPEAIEQRRQLILGNTVVYATQDERGRFGINCAPVGVGGIARRYLSQLKTVVLTSATLAIDGGFDHVESITGIAPKKTEILPTSFDYDSMGFVYIPRDLPVIGRAHPEYQAVFRRRVERAVRLCELSDGGAFILTTANDELDMFAEALKQRFGNRVFAQGHRKNPWDGDAATALAKFRATKDSIVVGSKSFWEGVDVPGGALRLVIMAKLPFPQYNDPIVKARERLAGERAFRDVQLVDMLVDLRQGVGRLIRTKDDRGCVAILDSRVWDKQYGGSVRRALPWSNGLVTSELSVPERYLPKFAAHFKRMSAA
jgi:ATP-dependent DNA helicase DinG